MFHMNTLLKKTPFPKPSISLLTRNFNDGIHAYDNDRPSVPTFDSLGLTNDLELHPTSESFIKSRLETRQQRPVSVHLSARLIENRYHVLVNSDGNIFTCNSQCCAIIANVHCWQQYSTITVDIEKVKRFHRSQYVTRRSSIRHTFCRLTSCRWHV
jgi:hypothetical protein